MCVPSNSIFSTPGLHYTVSQPSNEGSLQSQDQDLCWFFEWGHAHNMIADSGFYPDTGPHGFHAMMRRLSDEGWAHVSAVYMGDI